MFIKAYLKSMIKCMPPSSKFLWNLFAYVKLLYIFSTFILKGLFSLFSLLQWGQFQYLNNVSLRLKKKKASSGTECPETVVPNIFGTKDQFHGRQFFTD